MTGAEIAALITALDGADVASADSARCGSLLRDVCSVRSWLDATEARITSRVSHLHDTAGAAPAADVHTNCGGVSAAEGRRKDRRSKLLDEVPSFGDALSGGAIGAEHVDALANASSKLTDEVRQGLLDDDAGLLDAATSMSPEQFSRHVRERARHLERDHGIERNARQRRETFLSRKVNLHNGMIEGRFAFHPELGNQIFGAIDRQVRAMIAERERSDDPEAVDRRVDRTRLEAEALGELVAGGHQAIRPTEADITVIVDERTMSTVELRNGSVCETSDGLDLPPASIRRLLCTGRVTPVIVDASGTALDAGRTIRHANRRQRRALRAMYRTCAFGHCDVGFDRCEIHHILPWEHGGPTDLWNMVPLCSRHHHLVHEAGWSLHLERDRTLVAVQPDGTEFARTRPDVPDQADVSDAAPDHSTDRQRRRRRTAA